MTIDEFNTVLECRIQEMRSVLVEKAKVYASRNDRLRAFRSGAAIAGVTQTQLLWFYMTKHLAQIKSICDGTITTNTYAAEVIGDAINYLVLLEAILAEENGWLTKSP